MSVILLYTTSGCHLCEQAEQMLQTLADLNNLTWRAVEISEKAALVDRYGLRIPVIGVEGCPAELGWPFDETALIEFLSANLPPD